MTVHYLDTDKSNEMSGLWASLCPTGHAAQFFRLPESHTLEVSQVTCEACLALLVERRLRRPDNADDFNEMARSLGRAARKTMDEAALNVITSGSRKWYE